jgi:hypothetical protein
VSAALSATAERLAELLRAHRPKRARLEELWRMFDEVDPDSRMSLGRRRRLCEVVQELAEGGVIRLPSTGSYDRSERPGLPRFVTVVRAPAPATPEQGVVWHSELAWAVDAALTAAQREALIRVNEWLFRGLPRMTVPLRERSLEILGDEKALDALLAAKACQDGRLSLETLWARRVVPRLHTERVGDGSLLLAVENSDTFDSLVRALEAGPGEVGVVGWGAGAGFEVSVLSIPRLAGQVSGIRYFGDLDQAGLRIPANADRLARASGLPPVRPAVGLYDALLRLGTRQPGQPPVAGDTAAGLTEWLAPHQHAAVAELLGSGHRMAQEAVGVEYLTSASGWRPG